jgi:uncharacterized OsmC-like protein
MPSIEGSGFPLVFKVGSGSRASERDGSTFTTEVRSLEGMQKEALVTCGPDDVVWRLACDEGPYLNGKDMAPFPLAFFTAGMQFSFLSELLQAARERRVRFDSLELEQDNFYSMEGSFLRGDATGGAASPELRLKVRSGADAGTIRELSRAAERASAAQSLMRKILQNTFALTLNGRTVDRNGLSRSRERADDPTPRFERAAPERGGYLDEIIVRVKKGETVVGVEGGAGSSLQPEQKRTLHVHGEARWLSDMRMETTVHLFKPIGSSFRFLCDESRARGGKEEAPPPLAYLSAGIGFCYMTQLGRYAHISKQNLDSYRIVQKTVLDRERVEPVTTHVFVDSRTSGEDDASNLVAVGERTCFLHAAMRGEYPSRISIELNGRETTA